MTKLLALLRVNFLGLLTTFSGTRKGKKKVSGILLLCIMGALAVYISGFYSYLISLTLKPAGMLELLPVLMAGAACAFSLIFTAMGSGGIVFGGKDMDLMLSLPVSSFFVMLSKLLALYLENLLFQLFFLVPTGVVYFLFGGTGGVYFGAVLLLSTLFLAFFSTLLSTVVGFLLALIQSRASKNALLANLVYLVFLVLVFIGAFQINQFVQNLALYGGAIQEAFRTWLFPLGLFSQGLSGNFPAFLLFGVLTLLPFLGVVWVFSRFYKPLLSKLSAHSSRSNYHLGELAAGSQFSALFKKEASRFFSTPLYLFNTGIGILMAVGASVFFCFQRDTSLSIFFEAFPGMSRAILPAALLGFTLVMTNPAGVSVSLEGKYLWILKEAPVSGKTLFSAKALLNALLIWGGGLLSLPFLWFAFSLSPAEVLLLLCLCGALGLFVPCFGLALNLLFPKMDALSEVLVIKQSASSMICVLGGLAFLGVAAGLYAAVGSLVSDLVFILCFSLVLAAIAFLLWRWILQRGPKILQSL